MCVLLHAFAVFASYAKHGIRMNKINEKCQYNTRAWFWLSCNFRLLFNYINFDINQDWFSMHGNTCSNIILACRQHSSIVVICSDITDSVGLWGFDIHLCGRPFLSTWTEFWACDNTNALLCVDVIIPLRHLVQHHSWSCCTDEWLYATVLRGYNYFHIFMQMLV